MAGLFADVKVGDVFFTTHGWSEVRKNTVERVTASRFYDLAGRAYRKSDGWVIGQSGTRLVYAKPATQEAMAAWDAKVAEDGARRILFAAAEKLRGAKGDEAIRLAALLPPELKGDTNG